MIINVIHMQMAYIHTYLLQLHRIYSHAQYINGIMKHNLLPFLPAKIRSLSDKFLLVGIPVYKVVLFLMRLLLKYSLNKSKPR